MAVTTKKIKRSTHRIHLTWRIGVILKNKKPIFAQRIVRYGSKIIVAEKIKVALFEISKSMNVRIVGTVQSVVNVCVRKVNKSEKLMSNPYLVI